MYTGSLHTVASASLRPCRCAAPTATAAPASSSTHPPTPAPHALPMLCCRGALQARQVFFYKRAQIFVGDVWGAFGGQGLGAFDDIHCLTMFADYRVGAAAGLWGRSAGLGAAAPLIAPFEHGVGSAAEGRSVALLFCIVVKRFAVRQASALIPARVWARGKHCPQVCHTVKSV